MRFTCTPLYSPSEKNNMTSKLVDAASTYDSHCMALLRNEQHQLQSEMQSSSIWSCITALIKHLYNHHYGAAIAFFNLNGRNIMPNKFHMQTPVTKRWSGYNQHCRQWTRITIKEKEINSERRTKNFFIISYFKLSTEHIVLENNARDSALYWVRPSGFARCLFSALDCHFAVIFRVL